MNTKALLTAEFSFYQFPPSENQILGWAHELSDLTPQEVAYALKKSRGDFKRNRPPLPGEIRRIVYGFVGAEEAWARAPRSELDTCVVTQEELDALSISNPILRTGDEVAARMAFKETYERLVAQSLFERKRPKIKISEGWDANTRDEKIVSAITEKRISIEEAIKQKPDLVVPDRVLNNLQLNPSLKLMLTSRNAELAEISKAGDGEKVSRLRDLIKTIDENNKKSKKEAREKRELERQKEREEFRNLKRCEISKLLNDEDV